jgi:hypothetical protein
MDQKQVLLRKLSPFFKLFEHNNSLDYREGGKERIVYCLEYVAKYMLQVCQFVRKRAGEIALS